MFEICPICDIDSEDCPCSEEEQIEAAEAQLPPSAYEPRLPVIWYMVGGPDIT
jgi:hypothetical protein